MSTLLLAAFIMGDKVAPLNWLGFAVCLCGISLHVGLKACKSKSKCNLVLLSIKHAVNCNEKFFVIFSLLITIQKIESYE